MDGRVDFVVCPSARCGCAGFSRRWWIEPHAVVHAKILFGSVQFSLGIILFLRSLCSKFSSVAWTLLDVIFLL